MAYSKKWAVDIWGQFLKNIQKGGTPVIEVRSFDLSTLQGFKRAVETGGKNKVFWQHTPKHHCVVMYIEKGKGQRFNRSFLDLYASGVTTTSAFSTRWDKYNNNRDEGYFPKVKSSYTSQRRATQTSYIVADGKKGEQKSLLIAGSLSPNIPHRTHLISVQTTGIEHHKGLLIDFDGWLNIKPLNDFETRILKDFSQYQSIIWTTLVYRDNVGLHLVYRIYNTSWDLLSSLDTVDDRWKYNWYYDLEQEKECWNEI